MSQLFCSKWQSIEPDFVTYFEREWLGAHCNWFEGAATYTPSTNNALESHNSVIKRKITLRKRLPMNMFLHAMKTMPQDISEQFSNGKRILAMEPNIKRESFERAALMVKENFIAFKTKQTDDSNVTTFVVPSSKCEIENATPSYYKTLVRTNWQTFDEYIIHGHHQFYIVKFPQDSWKNQSLCTCPEFFKQFMCKHIIAVGVRLGKIDIPETANPVNLVATRRKPGRPKKITAALRLQTWIESNK